MNGVIGYSLSSPSKYQPGTMPYHYLLATAVMDVIVPNMAMRTQGPLLIIAIWRKIFGSTALIENCAVIGWKDLDSVRSMY